MVEIHRTDSDNTEDIFYDFGKRSPADDNFILAVMAIFKHHLPDSELGREVIMGVDDSDFDDAVRLAALVNPNVCNPLTGKVVKGAKCRSNIILVGLIIFELTGSIFDMIFICRSIGSSFI